MSINYIMKQIICHKTTNTISQKPNLQKKQLIISSGTGPSHGTCIWSKLW